MKVHRLTPKLSLRILYPDGSHESVKDDTPSIRSRFRDLVSLYNQHYFGEIIIEMLDNRNKVLKRFEQLY